MVKHFIFLAFTLIALPTMALDKVLATVDKNPVVTNESFVLTITADDDVEANALDTSALTANFIVGSTSVSRQTQMVNFKTSRETRWTTLLIAKNSGKYVIPAFDIQGKKTAPIAVVVTEAAAADKSSRELFIESDISATQVYVQQQITLTVKLFFAKDLKRGSLSEPEMLDANVQQIGKDIEDVTVINGVRYRVIERNYAISPQKSGEFVIAAPVFTGEVLSQNQRSIFSNFSQSTPVSVVGEDIKVVVKPVPESYQGQWLPSELVSIDEKWQSEQTEFKAGEPITRTITITAAGLSEEQIPEINFDTPDQIKVYPEQSTSQSVMRGGTLVSQKVKNFAVVVSSPGTYILPEIELPWWNTKLNKLMTAKIPAKTVSVVAGELNQQVEVVTPPPQITETQSKPETVLVTQASPLQWLFLAGWILTALAWFISRRRPASSHAITVKPVANSDPTALIKACRQHDGQQVLSLLLPWAQALFPAESIRHVSDVTKLVDNPDFSHELAQLQMALYSKNTQPWNGEGLARLVQQLSKKGNFSTKDSNLVFNPV